MLEVKGLHAQIDEKNILNGVSLKVKDGEVHALLGPNGSGKSTLSYVLAGHPKYTITRGKILFNGKDLLAMKPEQRSLAGIFLAFQHPLEIPGLNLFNYLFQVAKAHEGKLSPIAFRRRVEQAAFELGFASSFIDRELNVGFSGGEKKRTEMLQLKIINPKFAVLDEIDSGTDVDSLKTIGNTINSMRSKAFSAIIITHHAKLLSYVKPNYVHVMKEGCIIRTGGQEILAEIETRGYSDIGKKYE